MNSNKDYSETPPFLNINRSKFVGFYSKLTIFNTVDSIPNVHGPPSIIVTSESK
jgi:hypothetical protein